MISDTVNGRHGRPLPRPQRNHEGQPIVDMLSPAISGATGAFVKALFEKFSFPSGGQGYKPTTSGRWHFCWRVEEPQGFEPRVIDDVVKLKVDKKGTVTGAAENPFYEDYTLTGLDTPFAMTLLYRGKLKNQNLPGVCLILKTRDESEMHGIWWQIVNRKDNAVIGGTVILKRKT